MYILLDEFKQHINLDLDYKEEDSYLLDIIKSSEDIVAKRIDKKLENCLNPDGTLEDSIKFAILIMGATLYNQREAITGLNIKEVPTWNLLCDLNKKYKVY